MTQTSNPLTGKHRLGYALGDFGGCMTFSLMSAFMTRYYVNVALMDTAVIAVMTLIWKIFDAVSNPIVGVMMDKSFARSKGALDLPGGSPGQHFRHSGVHSPRLGHRSLPAGGGLRQLSDV